MAALKYQKTWDSKKFRVVPLVFPPSWKQEHAVLQCENSASVQTEWALWDPPAPTPGWSPAWGWCQDHLIPLVLAEVPSDLRPPQTAWPAPGGSVFCSRLYLFCKGMTDPQQKSSESLHHQIKHWRSSSADTPTEPPDLQEKLLWIIYIQSML